MNILTPSEVSTALLAVTVCLLILMIGWFWHSHRINKLEQAK